MLKDAQEAAGKFDKWADEHSMVVGANNEIAIPEWLKNILSSGKDAFKGLYEDHKAKQKVEQDKIKQTIRDSEWAEWSLIK